MKKFVNDPAKFVPEMLEGISLANPDKLKYEPKYNIIYRADRPNKNHVSVIQGSGCGHEPAHVMAVGPGMLDAASPGNVFAAPPMEYCLECIKLMNSPKGVLVLINNYQGDRMNWDMAIEMAEAEGINVKSFIIDDDVAVQNSSYTIGRRGVAGNFFVIKACGAAAEHGASLDELLAIAKKVNANVRTMGVALTSCTPPAKGKPIFELGDDEMEVGVGIHGEPGRRRDKMKPADAIVDELFDAVANDLPFKNGDRVALMINGLGGTPPSELYVLYRKAALRAKTAGLEHRAQLRRQLLHVARDGRRIADAAEARQGDRGPVGGAGGDRRPRVLTRAEGQAARHRSRRHARRFGARYRALPRAWRSRRSASAARRGAHARVDRRRSRDLDRARDRARQHAKRVGAGERAAQSRPRRVPRVLSRTICSCAAGSIPACSRLSTPCGARVQALLHHEQAPRVLGGAAGAAGIRDRFELLLGGDSLAEKKPSPLPLKSAADTLGVAPAPRRSSATRTKICAPRAPPAFASCSRAYGYGKIDETELGSSPRIRSFAELPAALGIG